MTSLVTGFKREGHHHPHTGTPHAVRRPQPPSCGCPVDRSPGARQSAFSLSLEVSNFFFLPPPLQLLLSRLSPPSSPHHVGGDCGSGWVLLLHASFRQTVPILSCVAKRPSESDWYLLKQFFFFTKSSASSVSSKYDFIKGVTRVIT